MGKMQQIADIFQVGTFLIHLDQIIIPGYDKSRITQGFNITVNRSLRDFQPFGYLFQPDAESTR